MTGRRHSQRESMRSGDHQAGGCMLELTVLCDDGTRQVSAHVELGHVLVDETDLPAAIGWTLKPEGLCRADVCVPVRDPNRMRVGHRLDLGEVVAALDRPWVADLDAGIAALGAARSERRRRDTRSRAPDLRVARSGRSHSFAGGVAGTAQATGGLRQLVRVHLRPARVAGFAPRAR